MIAPTRRNKRNILMIYIGLDLFIVFAFIYFILQGASMMKLVPVFGFLFLLNAGAMVMLLKTPSE